MKALVGVGLVSLIVCGSALAKFSVTVATSDATPAGGHSITFVVRSEYALDYVPRLIAVAPGQPVFRVVATITGETGRPIPHVRRRGFEVDLRRVAPKRWRGVARFPRRGRWRVVVPNAAPVGVVGPNGVANMTLAVY